MTTVRFHFGPAKTGTTALQHALRDSADRLRTAGIWYPLGPALTGSPNGYKHQVLTRCIRNDDVDGIADWLDAIEQSDPGDCGLTILSVEGLWRHWSQHPSTVEFALRSIGSRWPARGLVVDRDLRQLQASLYKQALINPVQEADTFTLDTFADWRARPTVAALWDLDAFVADVSEWIGGPVDRIAYGPDAVGRAWRLLTEGRVAAPPEGRRNTSLSDDAAELVRLMGSSVVDRVDRRWVVRALRRRSDGPEGTFRLTEAARAAILAVDPMRTQPGDGLYQPTSSGVAALRAELAAQPLAGRVP